MKCAYLLHRIGPYHRARLNTFAKRADLSVLEIDPSDDTYPWRNSSEGAHFRHTSIDASSLTRVSEWLDHVDPEVTVISGWYLRAALEAWSWSLKARRPIVLVSDSRHSDFRRSRLREWMKGKIVQTASAALVAGTPQRDYIATLGLSNETIFTGYDVVDNNYFGVAAEGARRVEEITRAQLNLPQNYFLSAIRLISRKNGEGLIRAYAAYVNQRTDPWHLVILGEGVQAQPLVSLARTLGVERLVSFRGFVQYERLPAYYAMARVFILPSFSDQWGLVVNEAMACSLPVLVSRSCGCASDLVVDGRNGFLFDPSDIPQLAESMVRLSLDATLQISMGRESKHLIGRWTLESFAEGLDLACKHSLRVGPRRGTLAISILLDLLSHRPEWSDRSDV